VQPFLADAGLGPKVGRLEVGAGGAVVWPLHVMLRNVTLFAMSRDVPLFIDGLIALSALSRFAQFSPASS
jgi:hypothetical protein